MGGKSATATVLAIAGLTIGGLSYVAPRTSEGGSQPSPQVQQQNEQDGQGSDSQGNVNGQLRRDGDGLADSNNTDGLRPVEPRPADPDPLDPEVHVKIRSSRWWWPL